MDSASEDVIASNQDFQPLIVSMGVVFVFAFFRGASCPSSLCL